MREIERESADLLRLRADLEGKAGPLSAAEIEEIIKSEVAPKRDSFLKTVDDNEENIKRALINYRKKIFEKTGVYPSRPRLCVDWMSEKMVSPFENLAYEAYSAGSPYPFIVWFDFVSGMLMATESIYLAEKNISGVTDETIENAISVVEELSGTSLASSSGAELYIKGKNIIGSFEKLLIEDPSGLKLLNARVARLEGKVAHSKSPSNFMLARLMLEGTRMTRDIYQKIYSFALDSF